MRVTGDPATTRFRVSSLMILLLLGETWTLGERAEVFEFGLLFKRAVVRVYAYGFRYRGHFYFFGFACFSLSSTPRATPTQE